MWGVQVIWFGLPGAGDGYTRLHFAKGGFTADTAHNQVVDYLTDVADYLHVNQEFRVSEEVLDIDPGSGEVDGVEIVANHVGAGEDEGNPVPQAAQMLVRLNTATFRGARRIKGRFNIPGLCDNRTINGEVQPVVQAGMDAAAATHLLDGTRCQLVVYSRPSVVPVRIGIPAPVISTQCWNEMSVLRSRRS